MKNTQIKIILADDDATDRMLFIDAFEEIKIKTIVHTVNNGTQLLKYLNKKGTAIPNLLFLDLNMPRKNGIECLKEIRNNDKLKDISIAIFSTSASEEDIEESFSEGANIYIKKPLDFSTLVKVLEKAVMATYQYQDPPFNRANFLLRI